MIFEEPIPKDISNELIAQNLNGDTNVDLKVCQKQYGKLLTRLSQMQLALMLDYYAALTDVTEESFNRALNTCVRFILNIRRDEHITPFYHGLRWLKRHQNPAETLGLPEISLFSLYAELSFTNTLLNIRKSPYAEFILGARKLFQEMKVGNGHQQFKSVQCGVIITIKAIELSTKGVVHSCCIDDDGKSELIEHILELQNELSKQKYDREKTRKDRSSDCKKFTRYTHNRDINRAVWRQGCVAQWQNESLSTRRSPGDPDDLWKKILDVAGKCHGDQPNVLSGGLIRDLSNNSYGLDLSIRG
ncbi:hypothetical protein G5I_07778 [Acromyrmex echinatior]|uniref:Uncharacterized protein n=1 Tax=Acromyrmex echinatior TaxID=103372 RepID=F4WPQ2_ACREC|nr:hypothetical protein G5I_07778 [Acromyrmex echinatior]